MQLYNGDCLEELKKVPDGSIDLVLTDPPYNIHLADWDTWDEQEEYINFMLQVFKEAERVLKDNGALYFFHNDIKQIALLMGALSENTSFIFNSFIIWNKGDFRAQGWKYPTEECNLRSWFNVCEYCLYYIKGDKNSAEWDKTGLERVLLDMNNFKTLRGYFEKLQEYTNKNKKEIINICGQAADHCFRWNSPQWFLPTEETYNDLINKLKIDLWAGFRSYADIKKEFDELLQSYEPQRQQYENARFTHNLDFNHSNIFNYRRDNGDNLHPCQKPLEMLERLIKCSTNKGGRVLDMFMGSGSTGAACVNTGRDFIGIERDQNYFEIAQKRIKDAAVQNVFEFD